jgi:hypothetical protein
MDNLAREQCRRFDREAVYPANRSILEYWLSLRRDDALPLRTDFDLRHVPQSLSKLSLIQIWPEERLVCRLSGTALVRMIGRDLTGCDIIANTAPEFRRERMARYVNCMDGFIHRSVRTLQGVSGDPVRNECLILPFGDVREDGSRQALLAADWFAARGEQLASAESAFVAPELSEYLAI